MSISADTLQYSEIQDAMESQESPESTLIAGFLEANQDQINDPSHSPPGKAHWEGQSSPKMDSEELWNYVRDDVGREEFD